MLPANLHPAMAAAEAALAERSRIGELIAELTAARPAAVEAAEAADAALNLAQADALLSGPTETALPAALAAAEASLRTKAGRDVGAAVRRAEEARTAAEAAAAVVNRIDRAHAALTAKLGEVDDQIEAAASAFAEAAAGAQNSARNAWATELREATRVLARALRKGYAVAAAYRLPTVLIEDVTVPNPNGSTPYLAAGTLALGNTGSERLPMSWRDDPDAVALHDQHVPVRAMMDHLRPHQDRLRRLREEQRLAEAEAARRESRRPTNSSYLDRQPVPAPAAPAPRFQPNTWADRSVATPPAELNRVHGVADEFAPIELSKPAA